MKTNREILESWYPFIIGITDYEKTENDFSFLDIVFVMENLKLKIKEEIQTLYAKKATDEPYTATLEEILEAIK